MRRYLGRIVIGEASEAKMFGGAVGRRGQRIDAQEFPNLLHGHIVGNEPTGVGRIDPVVTGVDNWR